MIQKTDCDHLNKQCGIPKCMRRASYWYVNRENGGRNLYACAAHDKEARVFVDTPWTDKKEHAG